MLTVTLKHPTMSETGETIPQGVVEYLGHVVGGMVKIRHEEKEYVIHPKSTVELT